MIEIRHVSKTYKRKTIFKDLNTTFHDSTLTVLLGENGAGKSTLLRMIAALETKDSGDILYDGRPLRQKDIQKLIGYIPQDIALFDHLTVDENIAFFKSLNQHPVSDDVIDGFCETMHLKERRVRVSQLSGGTKRKVNILIGLLGNPKVLILDEPTEGIDLKSRYDIHRLLNELKETCLIILTTHHIDEVEALADKIKLIGNNPFYETVLHKQGFVYENC
ncbi:ABC transporter ATP-binding protein [Staphylococcus massiliensis]|uniref:Putative ABC transporter ATP-binding protein n=1 Tax=Staphylococcus massiliensis S46 TaxID=1229783 RepID=K9AHQ6_9STAP|nr:ABC transporter ATP-binding protein [Staphylococcus massiliensis]EKU46809.1 putative ABC transporter ATP-binding protein [Staphylococcus massiliensis S46]MCG3399277.1 ABC transporter ATP-binding protein [Staphylococcus massiliensis]MCG3402347.1 ABC transporter ATP-binding protein [Staphylococcus massiliensis]MCG3411686.1 ABC transporter ATP-binding protein [Staphylococcus massiliensis]POA01703.1 ABC transporter ATP-binding protein [Staphylococcus massiliensis CCUG 55927]